MFNGWCYVWSSYESGDGFKFGLCKLLKAYGSNSWNMNAVWKVHLNLYCRCKKQTTISKSTFEQPWVSVNGKEAE